MIRSISCSSSDAYILAKGNITTTRVGADVKAKQQDDRDKIVIFTC